MKTSGLYLLAAVAAIGLGAVLSPDATAQQSRPDGVVVEGSHELNKGRSRKHRRVRLQCTSFLLFECCRNPRTGHEHCKPKIM